MNELEIAKRVMDIVKEFAGKKEIAYAPDMEFKKVIRNSLDLMRFLVELEESFDIYVDQEYLSEQSLNSFDSVIRIVSKIRNKGTEHELGE